MFSVKQCFSINGHFTEFYEIICRVIISNPQTEQTHSQLVRFHSGVLISLLWRSTRSRGRGTRKGREIRRRGRSTRRGREIRSRGRNTRRGREIRSQRRGSRCRGRSSRHKKWSRWKPSLLVPPLEGVKLGVVVLIVAERLLPVGPAVGDEMLVHMYSWCDAEERWNVMESPDVLSVCCLKNRLHSTRNQLSVLQ